ncbi:uncharacterized protein [Atheta coriaria]|uniref:uncharacterized protein n=1 Tax=Dalotia coriaria TaxID=877792 RepID=UPI0031F393B7
MEDISQQQIARLVLGYLKKENQKLAYNIFYKQCPHFEKYRQKRQKISTRYYGMGLEDILQQYSEIYTIVQPRLEDTEYFENKSFHYQELPQQLLYLLNHVSHGKNVTATPLKTLPGNAIQVDETETEQSSSGDNENPPIQEVVEVFKETLLAREELQEKIAHTINEVRCPEVKESVISREVESAIAEVSETQREPAFESLLQEILGASFTEKEKPPEAPTSTTNITNKDIIIIDGNGCVNNTACSSVVYNLTEQDILSMPVYVCNEKHDERVMVEQGVQVPEERIKMLPVQNRTETIADFITLYKCDDQQEETFTLIQAENQQLLQIEQATEVVNIETVIDTKTPDQTQITKLPAPAQTPKSGGRSHIRALDFKFQTPAKEVLKIKQASSSPTKTYTNSSKQKPSKSLFTNDENSAGKGKKSQSKAKDKPKEPWDMKFRAGLNMDKSPDENIDVTNKTKPEKATKAKSTVKKKTPQRKTPKSKIKTLNASPKNTNKAEKTNETTPVSLKNQKTKQIIDVTKVENVNLININKPPRFNRKCNTDTKKEVKLSIPKETETKQDIIIDSDKLVLSPSKLNGSKRSLDLEVVLKQEVLNTTTPEVNKLEPMVVPCILPSSSTVRNITPLLETPAKDYPKTPCVYNPAETVETPLTRVFNEQIAGMDIASIQTPKLILTPSFAITPFIDGNGSPSYNRPTDYSTSSSYYQPSDTEANKSLEKLIQECNRLETVNVIGRKNLNLMKDKDKSTSDESSNTSTSSSSSSSSSDDSESDLDEPTNATVVEKQPSRYPLRSRSLNTSDEVKNKDINDIVSSVEFIPVLNDKPSKLDDNKTKILSDLDRKRMRVLEGIKNDGGEKGRKVAAKKKKPATTARVLRSNTVKLKEEDLLMTSSDEELVIRPFEIVETELLCPNSNTEPEKTESVKNNAEPEKLESVKDNAVNSPVHDEILVVEDPKTAKKKKLVPVLEKLTKLAMKRKVEPVKTTKTPKKKVEKPPSEPKPEINIKPDENVKVLKGSTGEDAKNLIAGLKERGINLKERETIEKQEEEEATKVASKVEYETSVFIPKKENIGRCVTTINTPEEDLIFFDIRVFSDPIFFDGSNVQSNAAGIRDAKDDNLRLTKAYCMTTYDDATDAEIEK